MPLGRFVGRVERTYVNNGKLNAELFFRSNGDGRSELINAKVADGVDLSTFALGEDQQLDVAVREASYEGRSYTSWTLHAVKPLARRANGNRESESASAPG